LEQWNAIQERAGLKMAQSQPRALAGTSAGTSSGPSVAPSVAPEEDEIAQAIAQVVPTAKPARSSSRVAVPNGVETATVDTTTTAAPSRNEVVATAPITVSSQDIVRVQAGLKAFGNDLIQVDGVAGRTTQDAIREFQKLFGMQVSGNVDAALVGKMREIGLIS
ncbi:peptidoglycan-binding protein, partial [Paraburkholderia aspalathi]|nr:peptidoglycan-binding protein [Paraburkholderia aspalathi]